jgi:4-alpha-glucanotransferase
MTTAPKSTDLRPDPAIAAALSLLGKSDFLLAVHDASFPAVMGEDSGRGTPYGAGGLALARFAHSLGFTGLQLGPQGQTSAINPSPYDGTLFSRSILSLDLKTMVSQGLLSRRTWKAILAANPHPEGRHVPYLHSFAVCNRALDEVHRHFLAAREKRDSTALALDQEIKALWRSARWLRDDALYAALCQEHGGLSWRQWPQGGETSLDQLLCAPPAGMEAACARRRQALEKKYALSLERYALAQVLLLRQHFAFRKRMQGLGLKIYGDVQVGFSQSDTWSLQGLLQALLASLARLISSLLAVRSDRMTDLHLQLLRPRACEPICSGTLKMASATGC